LNAQEAERIGLITGVYPDSEVLAQAIAIAEQVAGYPALQTRLTRDLLRQNAGEYDFNVLLQRETEAFIAMFKARRQAERQT
jgi:enoyl-CoA hydratase/carnithine racemase